MTTLAPTVWDTLKAPCMQVSRQMGLTVTEAQCETLMLYLAELLRWNKAYNLTAITQPREMLIKHLYDTFAIVPFVCGQTILDVGTGAGIPGLILSVLFPEKQFTLLDSNGKKTRFLVHMRGKLNLENVTVVHARVEQYTHTPGFDLILARAFAATADILRLCEHLRAPDGQYALMKGQLTGDELDHVSSTFSVEQQCLVVPELEAQRHLLMIKSRIGSH